ncbi:iron-sulfur cluster-binding domain-containing protein [Lacibacter sp. H375]|uniref:flavin reductase family protein n=1 Tax=Lacibacter sp. H375 TaxID=3133424 RepID=UPI0030BE4D54
MKQHYSWKTAGIIRETSQSVTIFFDTQGIDFSFKAGQFINLTLSINGESFTRSYSLSSAPGEEKYPAITVKAVAGGIMSNYIVGYAEEITEWGIDGPHGLFHVTNEDKNSRWIVLIAGGSGISPLYSILKYLLISSATNILLIYSNKNEEDVIFADALTYMQRSFSHRLRIVKVFTDRTGISNSRWTEIIEGRLTRIRLKKIIKQYLGEQYLSAQYFVCGPEGLQNLASEVADGLGIPVNQFHKESFFPKSEKISISLPQIMQEVLLHHYERTNLLEIAPEKTILDAALEDHVPVQYSCKNGTCGMCIAKLTSGNVHMKQNYALQADQIAKGYILLCQSHPLDSNVTVEVNESI